MTFTFDKNLYIKRILFVGLIILTAVFQNTRGFLPEIASARAFVLIPLTVSIAMNEKSVPSMLFGTLAGTLWDFASPSPDGYYAILLCVIAFVCSMLVNFVMRNNIITSLLLGAFSAVIVVSLNFLLFIVMKHYDFAVNTLTNYYIPSAIYTVAFTPISYFIVGAICGKFKTDSRAIN